MDKYARIMLAVGSIIALAMFVAQRFFETDIVVGGILAILLSHMLITYIGSKSKKKDK